MRPADDPISMMLIGRRPPEGALEAETVAWYSPGNRAALRPTSFVWGAAGAQEVLDIGVVEGQLAEVGPGSSSPLPTVRLRASADRFCPGTDGYQSPSSCPSRPAARRAPRRAAGWAPAPWVGAASSSRAQTSGSAAAASQIRRYSGNRVDGLVGERLEAVSELCQLGGGRASLGRSPATAFQPGGPENGTARVPSAGAVDRRGRGRLGQQLGDDGADLGRAPTGRPCR